MAGIKRTTPDDPYSPTGSHSLAKRSRSSLISRAPATPVQERPLQQRTGGWFSFPVLPAVTNFLKGFGFISESEPTRTTPKRTPRNQKNQEGGGQSLSICGPTQSRYPNIYPALPNQVIDMTREADEQSDGSGESRPGPSRHTHTNAYARQLTLPDMGRLTLNGDSLAGQMRRRERSRKWDKDEESDDEAAGHPSRVRGKQVAKSSIPVMEEQLARFRELEFQAELVGDEKAQRDSRKTAQHFERALRDAKAERDAKREQERVMARRHEGASLIDYSARLAAFRPQQKLFGGRKVESLVPTTKRSHLGPVKQPSDITGLIEKFDRLKKDDDEAFRKLQGPTIPSKLSEEELAIVKTTLSNPSFKSPMAGTEQVDSRNIGRLKLGQWLADDNISYYLALVSARNASDPKFPKIHAFNTFFYGKIEKGGHATVRRWTKKVDIFAKDLILVPINVGGMHWIAAVINMNKKRIEYFDSMGSYGQAMTDVSDDEHLDKKGTPYDVSDWVSVRCEKAPQQNNGSDCGIFTCQTLELVARGADPIEKNFEFSQVNMPFFRQLMTYEIATGKLKKRW